MSTPPPSTSNRLRSPSPQSSPVSDSAPSSPIPQRGHVSDSDSSSESNVQSPVKKKRTWEIYSSSGREVSRATYYRRLKVKQDNKEADQPDQGGVAEQANHEPWDVEINLDTTAFPANRDLSVTVSGDESSSASDGGSESYENNASDDYSGASDREDSDGQDACAVCLRYICICNNSSSSSEHSGDGSSDNEDDSNDDDDSGKGLALYEGCEFTVDEAVLDTLNDFLSNNETKQSLKDHLRTFLKYLPSGNNMPKSSHLLFNYIKNHAPLFVEEAHFYCSKCFWYCGVDGSVEQCEMCDCVKLNNFYTFSIEDQIQHLFEKCDLKRTIDSYIKRSDSVIRDICDGSEFLRVKNELDPYSLTLLVNTDGVSISRSSKVELYPLLYVICEVPPHLRSCYMIVSGVWCDNDKPNMNVFLRPVAESLLNLNLRGGIHWTEPTTGVPMTSKVTAPLFCADAPVRSNIQNITSHDSKQGCNICEQRTSKIPFTEEQIAAKASGEKIRRKRAYLYEVEEPADLRTHQRMRKQAVKAIRLSEASVTEVKSVKGVRGPSVVSLIPGLDLSTCVYPEYMHSVCLGVVNLFLTLWFTVAGPWNISEHKDEINKFLVNILPSSDIGRLPRSLLEVSKFKASEFRSWLLFYSVPALINCLPKDYFQHWLLFVQAIYLLLQEEITEHDIQMSEYMLKLFVRSIAVLYKPDNLVYNVHNLIHLPLTVRRWGPLWATSAFSFENFNGVLGRLIHGTKNRAKELVKNLKISAGVDVMKRLHIQRQERLPLLDNRMEKALNILSEAKLSKDDLTFLAMSGYQRPLKVYLRAQRNREVFTSALYLREKKRNNFTVSFNHGNHSKYGEVKFFLVTGAHVSAVVKVFKVDQRRIIFHEESRVQLKHFVPVSEEGGLFLAPLSSLTKVLKVGNYIVLLPNKFERNL